MALPATINASARWPFTKNQRLGPHEVGSNLYAFLGHSAITTAGMYKSTDSGDTWAEQDSANHPTDRLGEIVDSVLVGATIYCLTSANSTQLAEVKKFDTGTDTWQALETGMTTSPPAIVTNVSTLSAGFLVVRGAGDYVVFHNGATESVMGSSYRRIKYSRFQSGAWTNNVRVDNGTGDEFHWDARAAQLGSSSRSHFFYTTTSSVNVFFQKALTSANVLQAEGSSSTGSNFGSDWVLGNPIAYVDGADTKVVVPYASDEDGAPTALAFGVIRFTSADAPTLSHQQVSPNASHPPLVATSNPGAAAVDSTTPYVFWGDAITDDLWHDNDAGTGTWGTDARFFAVDQSQLLGGVSRDFGADTTPEQIAQSFQVSVAMDLASIGFRFGIDVGTPTDDVLVDIVSSLGGTVLATSNAVSLVGAQSKWHQFVFASPPALSTATTYYAVLRRSGANDASNFPRLGTVSSDVYANGSVHERNAGVWSAVTGSDAQLVIPGLLPPTIQGISVGKITDAIGVLYNDNGVVKYDALTLEEPPPPPPQARRAAIRMTR